MENDLIRRRDALDAVDQYEGAYIADSMISDIPAVDAVEVRHGAWEPHPNNEFRETDVCTACGTGTTRREYGMNPDGKEWVTEWSYKYCPWCGARMDGRREDVTHES